MTEPHIILIINDYVHYMYRSHRRSFVAWEVSASAGLHAIECFTLGVIYIYMTIMIVIII